jgi:hypothetical protein
MYVPTEAGWIGICWRVEAAHMGKFHLGTLASKQIVVLRH